MSKLNVDIDKAMNHFLKKKYKEAAKALGKILGRDDLDLSTRSRLNNYKHISDRALVKHDDTDDQLSLKNVSILINEQEYDEAIKLLDQLKVSEDTVLYLKSEIAVEKNDLDGAAELLKKAIDLDRHNKGFALHSPSFGPHLDQECFAFLAEEN